MSGWILSAGAEVGMVRRVIQTGSRVTFSTRTPLGEGVHEINLWNGSKLHVHVVVMEAERITYDGPSWRVTAEVVNAEDLASATRVPAE